MSDKRIVGIDIGSYAVKVVVLDQKSNDVTVLGFEREAVIAPPRPLPDETTPKVKPPPLPTAAAGESFDEDSPTGVHGQPTPPAAAGDADETTEKGDGAEPTSGASIEFDDAPAWIPALRRLAERDALSGAFQATAMPDAKAVLVELEVPFADKAKVQNILPHLMVDRLPLPQAEITWDFQTYGTADEATPARALVGFARNTDVEAVLDILGDVWVDPAQLGVAELQLAVAGVHAVPPGEGVVAFVDLGHEVTRVAVVNGSEPLLGRTIRTGGRHITEAIQAKFDGTFEEAENVKHQYAAILGEDSPNPQMKNLSDAIREGMRPIVRDLRRTFQGLFARKRVEVAKVYICGGTSQIKNLEKYLSAELGIAVRRLGAPALGLGDAETAPISVVAFGAALSQQSELVRSRGINLRSGRFAYRGRSSYLRRQLVFAAAGIVALMLVLGLTLYMHKRSYEAQRDAMKAALETQTQALLGAKLTSKSDIQKVMDGEDSGANSYIPNMSAYHLLHEITVKMPTDTTITLERIEVDTDRNLIQIYGETTDAQAVDKIVSDLEQGIDCLKEIKKDKLKVRDDKAEFELHISSGCS